MISTPVAASRARIFRPSRPIILPFTSSESIWKIVTEFSMAVSVATRCIVLITIRLASLFAAILASAIISFMYDSALVFASSFRFSTKRSFACSAESPDIVSNCSTAWRVRLSISLLLFSTAEICCSKLSFVASTSFILRCKSP